MECSPQELKARLDSGAEFLLLDVRTAQEVEIAQIAPCLHVPLHALESALPELAEWRDREVICLCHHGIRSAHAQQILAQYGFTQVRNLVGGIHQYSVEVDPDIPTYG